VAAKPAVVSIGQPSKQAINPSVIWISPTLDSAIFGFDEIGPHSLPASLGDQSGFLFLEVSSNVVFGLDRNTRVLKLILVEAFGEQQFLFDTMVSAAVLNQGFMDTLNAIHVEFYSSNEPQRFAAVASRLVERRGSAESGQPLELLRKLIEFYRQDLETSARLSQSRLG
jgi:hypothetical protein